MIIERFKTLAKRNDSLDWIVEGLLTSGEWTYFVGEAAIGKSFLMIQLCDALQKGGSFLGMSCKRRNCLYVQVDTGRLEWKHQVMSIAGESFSWTAYALVGNFLDSRGEVETLRQIIWGEYEKDSQVYRILKGEPYSFIVFDVLNKMSAVDINTKPGMSHINSTLAYLTKRGEGESEENIHYVLVHHPNKSVKRGINAGSGYGGFSGLCGNMLTLSGSPKRAILTLEKSKAIEGKELVLERLPNGGWEVEKGREYDYKDILS